MAVARRVLREGDGEHIEVELTRDGETIATWTAGEGEDLPVTPGHFAFSNDGQQLAFDVRFEDGVSLYVLDLTSAPTDGDLVEAAREIDVGDADGAMNSRPFWLEDGAFGFVQCCCALPTFDTWEAVVYDLDADTVTRTLFTQERGITSVDVDPSGSRLLFTVGHDAFGDDNGGVPTTAAVWSGGEPSKVGTELRSPTW